MSWAVGYDTNWNRDVGYGVPAICDQPGCGEGIDRGLGYVCGGEAYGGEHGCGLFFCDRHLSYAVGSREGEWWGQQCDRCAEGEEPFAPKPDVPQWINHKLTDPSWQQWRDENPTEVAAVGGYPNQEGR